MKSYWPPPKAADNWSLLQPMSARRATSSSPAAMRARRLPWLVTSVLSFSSVAGSVPGRSAAYILLATWHRRRSPEEAYRSHARQRTAAQRPDVGASTCQRPGYQTADQPLSTGSTTPLMLLAGSALIAMLVAYPKIVCAPESRRR